MFKKLDVLVEIRHCLWLFSLKEMKKTMDTYITSTSTCIDETFCFGILTSIQEEHFVNSVHAVIFVHVNVCVVNVLQHTNDFLILLVFYHPLNEFHTIHHFKY